MFTPLRFALLNLTPMPSATASNGLVYVDDILDRVNILCNA